MWMVDEVIAPSTNDMDERKGPKPESRGKSTLMVPELNEMSSIVAPKEGLQQIRGKVPVNADVSLAKVMEPISCEP